MGPSHGKTNQQFEYEDKRQQVADIEAMIADFGRLADDLEQQIQAEQRASGISDVNHFAYPMFARAAMARRDNLRCSVRDLEQRLETARQELNEVYEQLKNAELADGIELDRFKSAPRRHQRLLGAMGGNR
jgi:predicted  nucleic acid-binding Zn-ribbon protein